MKRGIISFIYSAVMPYLVLLCFIIPGKTGNDETAIKVCFAVMLVLCFLGVPACVICNLASLTSLDDKTSAIRNIVIKVCHLPIHFFLLAITLGFMNPWLLLLMWVPPVMSISLLALSACCNIAACVKLLSRKTCSFKKALFFCLSGFVLVINVVGAGMQLDNVKLKM
ncbi:MAG: hypothetical protein IIZ46_07215 [Clostridia bacterium]|nr:hypothetical protein [Clostridia bacterium]